MNALDGAVWLKGTPTWTGYECFGKNIKLHVHFLVSGDVDEST